MNNKVRFPLRFFIITFIWSWILWTPLVLVSLKIIPVSDQSFIIPDITCNNAWSFWATCRCAFCYA